MFVGEVGRYIIPLVKEADPQLIEVEVEIPNQLEVPTKEDQVW